MANSTVPSRRGWKKSMPRSKALASDAAMSTHIMQDMWQKWVMIASVGGHYLPSARQHRRDRRHSRWRRLVSIDTSRVLGHRPRLRLSSIRCIPQATNPGSYSTGSQLTSSMYRDLKKGSPVEVDSILGDFLDRGKKAGRRRRRQFCTLHL